MTSGRDIFDQFLAGELPPRPAYVPLLRGITAQVGGVGHQELTCDPTMWANSLAKTVELFDLDGVVAGFHFSLLAEACGCELQWSGDRPQLGPPPGAPREDPLARGRLPGALEATKRVFEVVKNQRGCVAAVNGPLTVASQLFKAEGAEADPAVIKPALMAVYEEFCKLRPDVLLLMESGPLVAQPLPPALKRLYFTLKKIAAYYDVATGLYLQDYRAGQIQDLAALKMDLYILGPDQAGQAPPLEAQWELAADCLGIGLGLSPADPAQCQQMLEIGGRALAEKPGRNFFFTSLGPLKRGHDPQALLALVKQIRQMRR